MNSRRRTSLTLMLALLLVAASGLAIAQTTAPKQAPKAAPQATPARPSAVPKATGPIPQSWKQVPIPPLHPFKAQEPKRIELANGMVLLLQEDHELPLIDGTIRIRGGDTEVPNAKTGMMNIYGAAWRQGGTSRLTGDQMDDQLEARAARVETTTGSVSTTVSFSCLKQDFENVFQLAVELLRDPAFRQDKIDLAKTRVKSGISRRNDQVGAIVNRLSSRIAYGADNPYGREPEYDTVDAVTREDLAAFHKQHVHPNNIIVGIVGDFDPAQMEARLRQAFDSWPKGPQATPPSFEFRGPKANTIFFAPKDDVNQSSVRLIQLGTDRRNPDFFNIAVMDQIFFAGGFSARFVDAIRTKRGLAYSAGGGFSAPYDHPGTFDAGADTKSQTTVETITASFDEIKDMAKNPATPDELKRGKDAILNSFIFTVDSKDKILSERMTYELFHFPADYLERYKAGVEKTTLEDVKRVYDKYIHPEQMAVLVVGKASDFDKPLSSLGKPVETIDLTIPPPGGSKGKAGGAREAPANTPEAKALLAKVVSALGGEEKLRGIKSLRTTAEVTQKTPMGDITMNRKVTVAHPDRAALSMQSPMGEMQLVITPQAAFAMTPQGAQDLPPSARTDFLRDLHRSMHWVAGHSDEPGFAVRLDGTKKIGNVEAQVLDLESADSRARWFVDPATGLVLREEHQGTGRDGSPVDAATDFADYKAVDGILFPFTSTQYQNNEVSANVKVSQIEVNPQVDEKTFQKPQ
ncbi:MAG TPA: insulinase family protein [Terriglobales bacterium]|nr:insulinase family protein [Terriglobales bacterium]